MSPHGIPPIADHQIDLQRRETTSDLIGDHRIPAGSRRGRPASGFLAARYLNIAVSACASHSQKKEVNEMNIDISTTAAVQANDGDLLRKRGHRRLRSRVIRLACTIAGVAAISVTSLPAVTNAATPSTLPRTCYSTVGLTSCIESIESWNGASAWSTGRFYWCSNVPLAISDCHNHLEGSYWNGALGAWEDWANVSYKTAISPNVKFCVYLRLDVRPNGQHWSSAWASGPLPLWQGC